MPQADPQPVENADIETSSEDYARRFSGRAGKWMLGRQESIVMRLLQRNHPDKILDVGGGHAQLAIPLAQAGYRVTVLGSDASCQNRIQDCLKRGEMEFKTGNLVQLPYSSGQNFDTVISFRLLPHCDAWPALVGQCCRQARESVIVDYPTDQSLNCLTDLLFGMKKKLEGNTRTYTLFRHAEIDAAFKRHGFVLKNRVNQYFLPMVLHRMLKFPMLSALLELPFRLLWLTRIFGSPAIAEYVRKR